MSERALNFTGRVIGVTGGGGDVDYRSIPFRLMRTHLEANGIPFDGVNGHSDRHRLLTPPEQVATLHEKIAADPHEQPVLLIGQCLASIAVVNYLSEPDHDNVRAVLFSPAPHPGKTITYPTSQERRLDNETTMMLTWLRPGVIDYEISDAAVTKAIIPDEYLPTIKATNIEHTMRRLVEVGKLTLIATEYDWNTDSVETVEAWHAFCKDKTTQKRFIVMPGAGHSLHTPHHLEPDADQRIADQRRRAIEVIETGITLFGEK